MEEMIKEYLRQKADEDESFREKFEEEGKEDCIKNIFSRARKEAKGNCCGIREDIVYGWAMEFFDDEWQKIKDEKKKKEWEKLTASESNKVKMKTKPKADMFDFDDDDDYCADYYDGDEYSESLE